jgi:hypothetical protein
MPADGIAIACSDKPAQDSTVSSADPQGSAAGTQLRVAGCAPLVVVLLRREGAAGELNRARVVNQQQVAMKADGRISQ